MAESSKYKKCLVLDLDNTLWGGVVGEDGINGIELGLLEPGSHYLAFQQAVLDLYNRGVILAVASRNNIDEAMAVIDKHPNQLLRKEHFAALRINWLTKSENIVDLAKELNIGLDSVVFLDDDPVNRNHVRDMLSEVTVPELPRDPSEYASFLNSLDYFPYTATTNEDKMRGNLYVTERLRKESQDKAKSPQEFLNKLGLEIVMGMNDVSAIPRISQLTEKTNQFNLFKEPLDEDIIKGYMESPSYKVFHGRALDRFGDNGITNIAIARHIDDGVWLLEQFLMSCRVISRGVEEAFLFGVAQHLQDIGGHTLKARFAKTEKNIPGEEFYNRIFGNGSISINEVKSPSWVNVKNK